MPKLIKWWRWQDAFSKFGFEDGDGWNGTYLVKDFIESLGYEVECDNWGCHNFLIADIRKKIAEDEVEPWMDTLESSVSILFNPNNKIGEDLDDWNYECKKRMCDGEEPKEDEKFEPLGYAEPEHYLPEDLVKALEEKFNEEYEVVEEC